MDHKFLEPDITEHYSSVADILQLKRYLLSKLPMEIIDRIFDEAEYWASSSVYLENPSTARIPKDEKKEACLIYLRTLPLGIGGTEGEFSIVEEDFEAGGAARTKKLRVGCPEDPPPMTSRPCRKIEFKLWCHNDLAERFPRTYGGSYMWFDLVIEKLQTLVVFTHGTIEWPASFLFEELDPDTARPFLPSDKVLQKMVAFSRAEEEHTIVWHCHDSLNRGSTSSTDWNFFDGSFDKELARAAEAAKLVRNMQPGDCITLRVRTRFPESENPQKAKITVYWAV